MQSASSALRELRYSHGLRWYVIVCDPLEDQVAAT
jgi:hypothetical protein